MISEDRLQQECFTWHWNKKPKERGLLFMVYNGAVNRIQGAQLKSKGMVKGVSDMIYLRPGGNPLLIEVGRQSQAQMDWEKTVLKNGYEYHLVRSLEQFITLCK
jgi:hypothetical protein